RHRAVCQPVLCLPRQPRVAEQPVEPAAHGNHFTPAGAAARVAHQPVPAAPAALQPAAAAAAVAAAAYRPAAAHGTAAALANPAVPAAALPAATLAAAVVPATAAVPAATAFPTAVHRPLGAAGHPAVCAAFVHHRPAAALPAAVAVSLGEPPTQSPPLKGGSRTGAAGAARRPPLFPCPGTLGRPDPSW